MHWFRPSTRHHAQRTENQAVQKTKINLGNQTMVKPTEAERPGQSTKSIKKLLGSANTWGMEPRGKETLFFFGDAHRLRSGSPIPPWRHRLLHLCQVNSLRLKPSKGAQGPFRKIQHRIRHASNANSRRHKRRLEQEYGWSTQTPRF